MKKINFLICFILLFVGIFIRADDLSRHFSHRDDLMVPQFILNYDQPAFRRELDQARGIQRPLALAKYQIKKILSVPAVTTFAPLQFLATSFLLSPDQDYRDVLFLSRLPSFVFSILGLLLCLLFYWKYNRFTTPAVLMALTLLTFSWENIIYAKQSNSYSIGVFVVLGLLCLLWTYLNRPLTIKNAAWYGFLLALLSHAQYQMIFMIPAFLAAAFIYHWKNQKQSFKRAVSTTGILALSYGIGVLPLFLFFLSKKLGAGANFWNIGPHHEFLCPRIRILPLVEMISVLFHFFPTAFFAAFSAMTGFIPENHPLFIPIAWILLLLFFAGIIYFLQTQDKRVKTLGLFFLFLGITWILLILLRKITLGPTRHALVLLPCLAIMIAEGWFFLVGKINFSKNSRGIISSIIPLSIAVLFFYSYPSMMRQRKDPFDPVKIEAVLKQYNVRTVVSCHSTWNLHLMKNITSNFHYVTHYDNWFEDKGKPNFQRVAYVCHDKKIDEQTFNRTQSEINEVFERQRKPDYQWQDHFKDYRIIYSEERDSNTEMEFSARTKNGTNGFYYYVLDRNKLP
ncbi:MAG: hypothetical protein EXS63_05870 [Candidatus Omnitrophica bacterium]|nr:hypothetical protein [Candidatus Omnitrophota bacterium]